MSGRKLYFGHPVNVYNTPLEQELLEKIAEIFPGWEIENPNQRHHAGGYEKYKNETGNGMDYYTEVVLPSCSAGIFLGFRDGTWGAGVFREALHFADAQQPVWEISPSGSVSSPDINLIKVLSVSETRMRIRTEDGKPKPY
ncbi:MAG: hypothetical protein M0P64_03015 [Candidatus Pacebacteria bacterium]|jgi:hypothetical protein|nr:hypothetical protein [Candidatus Paceibacterota bacterium]